MFKHKKSLLASGLALLACFALLMGATFAWFTDSVSNTGNRIEAGELKIDFYWFKWDKRRAAGAGGQHGHAGEQAAAAF